MLRTALSKYSSLVCPLQDKAVDQAASEILHQPNNAQHYADLTLKEFLWHWFELLREGIIWPIFAQ